MLPAVSIALPGGVAAYVLVDSRLPRDGASPLELIGDERAARMVRQVAGNPMTLIWSFQELAEMIPQESIRQRFIDQLPRLPPAFYEEPIPVPSSWPDAPCAYLKLSPANESVLLAARLAGWIVYDLPGDHFHMLTHPDEVTDSLLWLARALQDRSVAAPPGTAGKPSTVAPTPTPGPAPPRRPDRFAEIQARVTHEFDVLRAHVERAALELEQAYKEWQERRAGILRRLEQAVGQGGVVDLERDVVDVGEAGPPPAPDQSAKEPPIRPGR
jgi:hypothetical protein